MHIKQRLTGAKTIPIHEVQKLLCVDAAASDAEILSMWCLASLLSIFWEILFQHLWNYSAILKHFTKQHLFRAVRLSNKLLGQGYVKERLKSSLRKFYGRYGDLIKQYEVPLSRMLHDILDDDHLQWHPPLIRHYTNFWPYYWSWPYYRIWLFT